MSSQLRAVDIHEYYRTGGIDWQRADQNFDIAGIRACVGTRMDKLLPEHINYCKLMGIPYITYQVPVHGKDPDEQTDFYLSLPGVSDGLIAEDIEPYEGIMVTAAEAKAVFDALDRKRSDMAWYYSNYYYTNKIGNPAWIKYRQVWWAEYRYESGTTKFRKFEPFLAVYPWWQPRWAQVLGIDVTLHQLTDYGDAQFYLARAYTDDPDWPNGIKSADLNVGLKSTEYILSLWDALKPPTPPTDIEETLQDHEQRIKTLEGFHEPEPPLPIDPGSEAVSAIVTDIDGTVAMNISGYNDNGVPIIDFNLYVYSGSPTYKFDHLQMIDILPNAIPAQGGSRWYKLANCLGYVDKAKVTKVT